MFRLLRASILGGCLLFVAACSHPVAPEPRSLDRTAQETPSAAASPRLFYPLDLGNHWRYHRVFTFASQVIRRSRIDHDQVCVDPVGGRDYVVDRITQVDSTLVGPVTYLQWVRARQDPTGLYEADLDIGTPAPCAGEAGSTAVLDAASAGWDEPAVASLGDAERRAAALTAIDRVRRIETLLSGRSSTAGDGELTRLRYPMVVGATWVVRAAPIRFTATIEGFETLTLPVGIVPAYRVRIDSEAAGAGDRILFWYGRSGMLGMLVHVEIPTGSGLLIAEDAIRLEDLRIDRGRF